MNKVFCLMGPTASGKTAIACELVQHFPFEIISVDSAMIYREMTIGTAKPDAAELALAPHHLIDILDPPQSFSAAEFCTAAKWLVEDIFARGKIPLLVGGTMMYFHAFQQGLSLLPEANELIRRELAEQADQFGWAALHAELLEIDPQAAAKIHSHDRQRIQRALEVFRLTGKSLSSLRAEQKKACEYELINLILFPEDRALLHRRIAERFASMLQRGFLEEAEQLIKKWQLPPACPAMRCVGYRQARDYLEGKDDYQLFCDKAIAATRQLAKRQLTWLRGWSDASYLVCDEPIACRDEIIAIAKKILDNPEH